MGERRWGRCDASNPPLPHAGVLPELITHNLIHSLPAEGLVDLLGRDGTWVDEIPDGNDHSIDAVRYAMMDDVLRGA